MILIGSLDLAPLMDLFSNKAKTAHPQVDICEKTCIFVRTCQVSRVNQL